MESYFLVPVKTRANKKQETRTTAEPFTQLTGDIMHPATFIAAGFPRCASLGAGPRRVLSQFCPD